jgi:DNA-binding PadR family transcriptional regulator
MRIPFYILGLLMRYGPQHGEQIRKTIGDEVSDFTGIKPSVIYSRLGKMEKEGLLDGAREKTSGGPGKTRYSVTGEGRAAFRRLLGELLHFEYRPTFDADGLFYFHNSVAVSSMREALEGHIRTMQAALDRLRGRKAVTIPFVPEAATIPALTVFSHHERHYEAELAWAKDALASLGKGP